MDRNDNKSTYEWINKKGELVAGTLDEYEKYRTEHTRIIKCKREGLCRTLYSFELNNANRPHMGEKDSRWHESWFPLMKFLTNQKTVTMTYVNEIDNTTHELNNIIVIVTYKNGIVMDYWLSSFSNENDKMHYKRNLELGNNLSYTGKNKYDTILMSNIKRGSALTPIEVNKLVEDKYVKQQYKYGNSVFEEEHFLFNCREFNEFVKEFEIIL
ncbi:MAG: hypothetical protein Terrestrivirus6_59 [Terrestrivirus sp.]|uniref:Uncharacterized protein n=1 Tax=Terrestrivirus sp. TaxID=2487775 RepID=A0A3G4ZS57_9VIRU|nr:MAG: hypothetical protein Terrestrivirus6_59 [Terrestrivirus sp.]